VSPHSRTAKRDTLSGFDCVKLREAARIVAATLIYVAPFFSIPPPPALEASSDLSLLPPPSP
jgi:hypothetical protein